LFADKEKGLHIDRRSICKSLSENLTDLTESRYHVNFKQLKGVFKHIFPRSSTKAVKDIYRWKDRPFGFLAKYAR
jgi:hypothetical protein